MKLEELARLAGVSKATASIILNGRAERYRISQTTVERVLALARKYHYVPNAQASGLRSSISKLVALILPDLSHTGFATFSNELEQMTRKAGYQLLISCTGEQPETEKQLIQVLASRQVDAFVVASSLDDYSPYLDIESGGTPVVLVDRTLPHTRLNCITSDDCTAVRELVTVLLQQVPEGPVYLGGILSTNNSQLRLKGYRDALTAADRPYCDERIFHRDFKKESGYQMINDYFRHHGCLPQCLFTSSFTLMEGVLRFAREHLQNLPDHPAWGTLGGSFLLDWLPFPVQSAPQNYKLMAHTTMTILDDKLNGRPCEQQVTLQRKITRRDQAACSGQVQTALPIASSSLST